MPTDVRIERRVAQVGSARVSYRVAGRGRPVVLIHGLGGSGRWWDRNISGLATRFHVHVLDLVGFGESRGRTRVAVADAAALVAAWMDSAGLERAAIVGHSMGGLIAADLAAGVPGRVERLVLVAAAVFFSPASLPSRAIGLARAVRYTSPTILPLLAIDAYRAGPRTVWAAARELLATGAEGMLGRVATPTLVVWGEYDTVVPLATGERIARLLPQAELAVIPRAGHNPMWDRPLEFNRLVTEFLSGDAAATISVQ